jgi:hypothetical protein
VQKGFVNLKKLAQVISTQDFFSSGARNTAGRKKDQLKKEVF